MITLTKKSLNSLTIMCCCSLLICVFICSNVYSTPTDKATYQEIKKDGRIYVFTSHTRMEDFVKSGELGKGFIAKIGYGPNGKTVLFDSQDAVEEYDSRHEVVTGVATESNYFYQQIKIDGRVYVFTSLERMKRLGQSGELGKAIIKVGYGSNSETVIFDSDEAVKEYDIRNIR